MQLSEKELWCRSDSFLCELVSTKRSSDETVGAQAMVLTTDAEAEVASLCERLSERLSHIYVEELRHGPGGIALELQRTTDAPPLEPRGESREAIERALARAFGMARDPRFGRGGAMTFAEPEPAFVDAWRRALISLIGPAGVARFEDVGGLDDGFTLRLAGRGGAWVLTANQAHD